MKDAQRRYQAEHREELNAKQREYYKSHKEQFKAASYKWIAKNKDRHRAYMREYYAAHRDELLARRRAKYHEYYENEKRRKGLTNKKIGNGFESEFCDMLAAKGFWAHNFRQGPSGQPCDIIAVKNNNSYLIDAKVCSDNTFRLTRAEANQISAMSLFYECGNNPGFFALQTDSGIYMVPLGVILHMKDKTITEAAMKSRGYIFEEWCKNADRHF